MIPANEKVQSGTLLDIGGGLRLAPSFFYFTGALETHGWTADKHNFKAKHDVICS
jgi:hypothetical protein